MVRSACDRDSEVWVCGIVMASKLAIIPIKKLDTILDPHLIDIRVTHVWPVPGISIEAQGPLFFISGILAALAAVCSFLPYLFYYFIMREIA